MGKNVSHLSISFLNFIMYVQEQRLDLSRVLREVLTKVERYPIFDIYLRNNAWGRHPKGTDVNAHKYSWIFFVTQ